MRNIITRIPHNSFLGKGKKNPKFSINEHVLDLINIQGMGTRVHLKVDSEEAVVFIFFDSILKIQGNGIAFYQVLFYYLKS